MTACLGFSKRHLQDLWFRLVLLWSVHVGQRELTMPGLAACGAQEVGNRRELWNCLKIKEQTPSLYICVASWREMRPANSKQGCKMVRSFCLSRSPSPSLPPLSPRTSAEGMHVWDVFPNRGICRSSVKRFHCRTTAACICLGCPLLVIFWAEDQPPPISSPPSSPLQQCWYSAGYI